MNTHTGAVDYKLAVNGTAYAIIENGKALIVVVMPSRWPVMSCPTPNTPKEGQPKTNLKCIHCPRHRRIFA